MARNHDFAKGEGLEPQVKKKLHKFIKIGRHGEQISTTQTYHRQGLRVKSLAAGVYGDLGANPLPLGDFL